MIPIRPAGPCQAPTDAIPVTESVLEDAARFLTLAWVAFRRLCASRLCQILVAAGLVNLAAGLVFGLGESNPTTSVVVDRIYANFAMAAWALAVAASGEIPGRHGWHLAAKATAVVATTLIAFLLAGLVGAGYQWLRGHGIEWDVYAHGLLFNLGWNAAHLAVLAVVVHAVIDRRWLATTVTAAAYATANLAFDTELVRFAAPIDPFSDIGGYGVRFAPHLALGIYWTGLCAALLVGVHLVYAPSGRRLTPTSVAWGWGGLVVGIASGCWVAFRPVAAAALPPSLPEVPRPVYSRIDLQVELDPAEGWLRSRGSAVVVNKHDAAIPDIHFDVPPGLAVKSLSLTGERLAATVETSVVSFRLNRPLEPRETLKVAFDFQSRAGASADRVVANGTVLRIFDVLPALGGMDRETFFARAPPTTFGVRLATSLDQIAVAPGALEREWKENGARFFEYRTNVPIRPVATFHSGRFAVAHRDMDGTPVEIYYHPSHGSAVAAMAALARTRLGGIGGDLPGPVRVVEVPDWRHAVRPPGILGFNWRRAANKGDWPSDASVLSYSELAVPVEG
ncbi:MAG: hypothetical protein OXG82_18695 [Gammaproteobacteria bacterium]|nr:hypothetical protein [Gammaproteobacteria bacterium]